MNTLTFSKESDLFGMFASGLCAVHCAATPFFFAARPLLDNAATCSQSGCCSNAPWQWAMLDYLFLFISLVAVWYSAKHTTNQLVKFLLWAAWGCFALGLFLEGGAFEFSKWIMYTGSAGLVATHIVNYRYCRTCRAQCCNG